MARPRAPAHSPEARGQSISVRVTAAQKDWLRKRAKTLSGKTGFTITMSAVACQLLAKAIEGSDA